MSSPNYKESFENATALFEVMFEKVSKTIQDVGKEACDALDSEIQLKKLTYERKRKIYELGEEVLSTKAVPQELMKELEDLEQEIQVKKEEIANKQKKTEAKE